MFGLTKREQRWKAEKEAAEAVLGIVAVAVRAQADIAVAEAKTDAHELERLRTENAALRQLLLRYRTEVPLGHQPAMTAHLVDVLISKAPQS